MSCNALDLTELLISERQPLLRHLARYLDLSSCEDTYQAMYFKLSTVPREPPIEDKRGYLFRVASNLAIDQLRDSRRRREQAEAALALLEGEPGSPDTARVVAAQEAITGIARALRQLPPRTRQVFVLNRYDGLSHLCIAAQLGICTSTVENHMRRALECLARARDGD